MNVLLSNEQYVTFSNIDNVLNFKNIKNEKIYQLKFLSYKYIGTIPCQLHK